MTVRLTDGQLLERLGRPESELIERKRTAADRSAIRRTICAFANDLGGHGEPGVILVGIEDHGSCARISITDEELRVMAQMQGDGNILPPPSMTVEQRSVDGCPVIVLAVQPSSEPPVRYQGRAWVRSGPAVRLATPEEERRLSERRRSLDLPFDLQPATGSSIADLDEDYARETYLPRAIASDVLEENRRSLDQQLRSLRLMHGVEATHGGLLALGRDAQSWVPSAWVQFLRIDGTAITDAIRDQKTLTGRLDDVLRRLEELLELSISVRTDIVSAPREIRRPDYPLTALQQLARNAIMHRTYEGTHAPVRITWYADRVEIQNPGGLYGQVTPQNFGTGVTDYRNLLIAEIMVNLGYAQRFGLGIPQARESLAANGNPPPEFRFEPPLVGVTIRPAP